MKIGILALQGAVGPHKLKFNSQADAITAVDVRLPKHLEGLSGIILPGGESSAMLKLLALNGLWEPLREFASRKPTWGICAGSILLASKVTSPVQDSLKLLDIEVERNGFGRQKDSFIDELTPTDNWTAPLPDSAVFIRAPRIRSLGKSVKVLFTWKSEPVMVEQGHLLASTFHPELGGSNQLHEYFAQKCRE